MWCYTISIWQGKIRLHLRYTRGRASTLCSCPSVGSSTKVGVRETWSGCLVIEMHVLSCQTQQTNIYSFHLNSFWQLRAPGTTNNPQTTNSFDIPSTADQSKSVCQQMQSLVLLQYQRDCNEFSTGLFFPLLLLFGRGHWNGPSSPSQEKSDLEPYQSAILFFFF